MENLELELEKNRQTEIVEPYKLPDGWKWTRLGDVADFIGGGTPDKSNHDYWNGIIPWASVKDIKGKFLFSTEDTITEIGLKESASNLCEKEGLILVTRIAPGKAIISKIQTAINQDLKIIQTKENKLLLKYFFDFYEDEIKNLSSGTTVKGIKLDVLEQIPFPLPPTLAEQQRIVNRIETMFSKLDQAQEKAQTVLDSFETRKAAILHKAFSGQLKIDNEELTIDDWEDTTIGECCKLGSGGTPLKSHPEYYENGNIPWLKTGEIDWNDIYDVEEKITNEGVENSSAKIFPAESVVVAMYGMGVTRGKAAIIKIPTTTNQAVCVLQPNEKLNNRFLFYYFMCNYWQIREQSVGGNQLNLSGKIIASFPIKLPPLNYQLSIVNFLDTVLEKENRAKEAAQTVLDQIALLKKSILARAFRGEI
ncbi:MAG: restriction endonuclease subunit S [Treponema sp.]|nr:restriction endonuclease subunit S [Treponema sp.]